MVEDSNSLPDRSDLQIHHFKKVRAITFIQKSTSITGKNESPVSHRGANFFLSYFFSPLVYLPILLQLEFISTVSLFAFLIKSLPILVK